MPHKNETGVTVEQLHPTFSAQINGVDFSKPVPADTFQDIYDAITKVSGQLGRPSFHRDYGQDRCTYYISTVSACFE